MASADAKKPRLPCYVDIISNPLLAKIFTYLPHNDRLYLSEVCRRWRDVGRLDWLDVVDLDLTPIPSPNIGAVLRLCPNVESIHAVRRLLIADDLISHYQTNLTSVKLFDVKLGLAGTRGSEQHTNEYRNMLWLMDDEDKKYMPESMNLWMSNSVFLNSPETEARMSDLFATILNSYFEKLPQLEELVLHNLCVTDLSQTPISSVLRFDIRAPLSSLTRLQLSGCGLRGVHDPHHLMASLYILQQLECLILHIDLVVTENNLADDAVRAIDLGLLEAVASLQNLRELSLGQRYLGYKVCTCRFLGLSQSKTAAQIALRLPKLAVLFLFEQSMHGEDFCKLYTTHPTLRVLMLNGESYILDWDDDDDNVVPKRHFQMCTASEPLPFLHVLLAENQFRIPFEESAAAKIVNFDCSVEAFLADRRSAAILDGVWVAERMIEAAQYDPYLTCSPSWDDYYNDAW